MIQVDFFHDEDRLRLRICGHANYAEAGADIVCAAASGIFYAALGYLANFECDLKINKLDSGIADIECSERGVQALGVACIGFIQIEQTYPGYIKVSNSIFKWNMKDPVRLCS